MKKKLVIITLALTILFGVEYKNQAEANTTVSFSLFFNALAPYGNWVSVPTYGYVWDPTGVGPGWSPYTNGHWVWSDYGWAWVSYEPWGWAPYHYGRWVSLNNRGWVWIPGTVWAPAWVTWYTSPSYIGWAPLAPDNQFFLEIGIGQPAGYNYYIQPSYSVFVPSNYFLNTNIRSVVIPRSQNVTIIKNTTNINNGPDVRFVEKTTRVKVQKVNVIEKDIDTHVVVKGGTNINKLEGKNYYVFRPNVAKKENETPLLKREPKQSPVKTTGGNEPTYPNEKKAINKGESVPNQDNFEEPHTQSIQDGNKTGDSPVKKTSQPQNPGRNPEKGKGKSNGGHGKEDKGGSQETHDKE